MNWLSPLPLTAVVAIVLFVSKELLESFRRLQADRRKIKALKDLLARECELNLWVVKSLRRIFSEIHTGENENPQVKIEIHHKPSGRPFVKVFSDDGGLETHMGVPKPHRELMSKFLLDVATLDRELFLLMEPAYEALAHLEHIRESLVHAEEDSELIGQDNYLEGLARYALEELNNAEASLAALYKHCTGNELTKHRLR